MARSSVLPSLALAVAMGSLFAPPVFGLMGLSAKSAPRESALVIEREDPAALAALSAPFSRRARQAAAECPAVNTEAKAPLPPTMRTRVAELAPHTVR
ncbi:hypothetical protein [uncultured Alsobacter sp.]|uniref:hypothetical protein n=1 Tax=uncultured Alsobacter sp. TaxID=1748258 RepID=UPI0025DBC0DD|nr:hypothetical protein [uncultured Alsobacter sp.]